MEALPKHIETPLTKNQLNKFHRLSKLVEAGIMGDGNLESHCRELEQYWIEIMRMWHFDEFIE